MWFFFSKQFGKIYFGWVGELQTILTDAQFLKSVWGAIINQVVGEKKFPIKEKRESGKKEIIVRYAAVAVHFQSL